MYYINKRQKSYDYPVTGMHSIKYNSKNDKNP